MLSCVSQVKQASQVCQVPQEDQEPLREVNIQMPIIQNHIRVVSQSRKGVMHTCDELYIYFFLTVSSYGEVQGIPGPPGPPGPPGHPGQQGLKGTNT